MNELINCIKNKEVNLYPIWFMRQAGRYLPEFRKIRKNNPDFIKLCLNEKLIEEITLQPIKRFNLSAAIIFSDILMIPYGLNQNVIFKKDYGPSLGYLDINNILSIDDHVFTQKLLPIYNSIKEIKKKTKNKSVIGFVGAPWTLLLYMFNKKSPKKDFDFSIIEKDKNLFNKLLNKILSITCVHIKKQVESGADTIQIFDSWAGLLPKKELPNLCYYPIRKLVKYINSLNVNNICFPRGIGNNYIDFCNIVKPDCISIDYETDPKWIKEKVNGLPIQGGMNPEILLGDKNNLNKKLELYTEIFKDYPYIFNLGHGVLPNTKPDTIDYIVKYIEDKRG